MGLLYDDVREFKKAQEVFSEDWRERRNFLMMQMEESSTNLQDNICQYDDIFEVEKIKKVKRKKTKRSIQYFQIDTNQESSDSGISSISSADERDLQL